MEREIGRDRDKNDLCSSFKGPPGAKGGSVSEYCRSATSASSNFPHAERDLRGSVMEEALEERDLGGGITEGAWGGRDGGAGILDYYDEEMPAVTQETGHTTHFGITEHQEHRRANSGSSDEDFVHVEREPELKERLKDSRQLIKEYQAKLMKKNDEFLESQREIERKNNEIQELRSALDDSRARARMSERNLRDSTTTLECLQRDLESRNAKLEETRRHAARMQQWVLTYESEFHHLVHRARIAEERAAGFGHAMEGMRTTLADMQRGLNLGTTPGTISRETSSSHAPLVQQSFTILPPRPGHGQMSEVPQPSFNRPAQLGRLEADGPGINVCHPTDDDETPVMLTVPYITHPTDE